METVFLIIKVVKIRHEDAMQTINELHKEIKESARNNPSKQVIETNIIQLDTKI